VCVGVRVGVVWGGVGWVGRVKTELRLCIICRHTWTWKWSVVSTKLTVRISCIAPKKRIHVDTVDKLYICKEKKKGIQLIDKYLATPYNILEAFLKLFVPTYCTIFTLFQFCFYSAYLYINSFPYTHFIFKASCENL